VKGIEFFKEDSGRLRFLEREEIPRLLSNCNDYLLPIVTVALNTGMRRGELFRLKWHDIDIRRDVIHLYKTKNGEARDIPMNEVVKATLIKVRKHPISPYVFCREDGKPYYNLRKSFFTALKKSDIVDFRFHDLRHTFASQLVMSGVDLNTVRELLGHKSLAMTLRYAHLSPNHKKRAVDVLAKQLDTFRPPEPQTVSVEEVSKIVTISESHSYSNCAHSSIG
jgi:integrase